MSKALIVVSGALLAVGTAVLWQRNCPCSKGEGEPPVRLNTNVPEATAICPWREPDADLKRFFPSATRYEEETRILSGMRLETGARLGRALSGDENALRVRRVYVATEPMGSILTRRVKGEYGAIEIVVAIAADGTVRGMRLQRLREPAPAAGMLQDAHWLETFCGKGPGNKWTLGEDIGAVPAEARASAEAIVEGARSLVILLAATQASVRAAAHH